MTQHILIVEDEIIIARELEQRLKSMGYEVAGIAATGREAIRLAVETQPNLVLMDIVLKGEMDGIEAATEIRRRCQLPVIYLTAYTDKQTLERAKVTEPFAYIVKPFSERELNANIEMALYKHRVESRLRRLERWFVAATDEVADAVIATDQEGVITVFNPAAEAITEWTGQQAIGKKLEDVFRLVDRTSGRPVSLEGMVEGPVVCLAAETRLLDKSDRRVPVDSTTSCVRDEHDRPSGSVSVFRDLTGQRNGALVALNGDVAMAAAQAPNLQAMLQSCAEALVRHLNAALARIWILDTPGTTLILQAGAGVDTQLDGPQSRVSVAGQSRIGRIAQEQRAQLTHDLVEEAGLNDPEWARREQLVAFAGYPLMVDGRLVGVLGLFSRRVLQDSVLNALGSVANAIAVGIERKRTETERDNLLAMLRMQIERMPLAYVLLNQGNRVLDWNPAAQRMFGYSKDEMLDQDPLDRLVPPSARDQAQEVLRRLRTGDMSAHSVNVNNTKDGRIITCEWLNTPLMEEDGRVTGVLALAQDVTERMRLENQVRQAQQRLEHVVSSSPAVLYTLGGEAAALQLTWISENVRDMMGYPLEEVMQPDWWYRHVHPDDLQRTLTEIQTELFPRGSLSQEYRFLHQDGECRWVRSELRLLRDDSGDPLEIVGSWSDITQRKQLEHQLQHAQKMEAVGELAGGVAHDFNNLLTVISGYSEIVLGSPGLNEATKRLVGEISKAGDRAAGLTRQLLAFSRKQILAPQVLDLNALVTEQEKMLRRLIGEDVVLTTALDPSLSHVRADPGQLEQVIMNLAVNARDAMLQGGKLTIETRNVELDESYAQAHHEVKPGHHVLLAVSDTGCGMTPETVARVFEPFFTTKAPGKGTGLGLATVYGIVKQSGGHIAVYSEPALGTTFKIYLPREEQRPTSRPASGGIPPMPQGSETILLVEDEDAVRGMARHALQACGYRVLEASNGVEALRQCERHQGPIHLIVTDVVMPEMAGRILTEHLGKLRPDSKVLYMSGYTDDAVIRHGVLQAEMAFLQKPFTPHALATKVRGVLDARR